MKGWVVPGSPVPTPASVWQGDRPLGGPQNGPMGSSPGAQRCWVPRGCHGQWCRAAPLGARLRVLALTLPRDWGVPADVPPQPAPLVPNHANLQPFNLLADIAGGCQCFAAHISLRAGAGGPAACAVPATRAALHGSRASLGWSSSEGDLQDLPELLCRSQPSTSD